MMITYSSGLGVSETARLKMTDIDSKRMMVRIRDGKGDKDRYSILSHTALAHLRQYWEKYPPTVWLFEGAKKDDHINTHAIQLVFYVAKERNRMTLIRNLH